MADQNVDSVQVAIGAGTLGFGAIATLTPRTLRRVYGDTASSGGALDYFGRTWGTRTAVLGALMLTVDSDAERTRLAAMAAAMNAVDAMAAFGARDMPGRTKVMAGMTSAGFAVALGYLAMNG